MEQSVIDELRIWKHDKRRCIYRASSLSRYRHELQWLREHGGTYAELQQWLRRYHHVRVHLSSVEKSLKSWGEGEQQPVPRIYHSNDMLHAQLMTIREQLNRNKKTSSLATYRHELQWLREHGGTYAELQQWLRRYHHVRVHVSSVEKAVKKWSQETSEISKNLPHLEQQLLLIKEQAKYRKRIKSSCLDKYQQEILHLHENDASLADIQHWLRKHKRLVVNRMMILRKIRKWGQD